MSKTKEDKKICLHCKKEILDKDKYISLITHENGKEKENVNMHFQCWIDYFNMRVQFKMRSQIEQMKDHAMQLFNNPMISGMLSQISGSNIALNLLNTPLNNKIVPKKIIEIQIENDRAKKRSNKRTSKKCEEKMQEV
jgi:hypothetical protein